MHPPLSVDLKPSFGGDLVLTSLKEVGKGGGHLQQVLALKDSCALAIFPPAF